MATVRPFEGITYNSDRVGDLGEVSCPPYDVISPEQQSELYARHPNNFVRVVLGEQRPADDDSSNRYSRAREFFTAWVKDGVLRSDERPAIYVYRQVFEDPTGQQRAVWGMVATISLDDEILAHEHTMSGPKADRLALMKAVPANLSPIYAIYSSDSREIAAKLRESGETDPLADFVDSESTQHSIWAIHDADFHARIADQLADSPIMIADGHHRFATAQNYRDFVGKGTAADSIMTLLVDAASEPVTILPYHRIVRRTTTSDVMDVLQANFSVVDLGPSDPASAESAALELWAPEASNSFIAFVGDRMYRLTGDLGSDEIPAGGLKRLALEPLGAVSAEHDLDFTPDAKKVCSEVTSGRAVAGFCIPPVGVDQIWSTASTGGQMPEKSTYFHPKPKDGFVIRSLDESLVID